MMLQPHYGYVPRRCRVLFPAFCCYPFECRTAHVDVVHPKLHDLLPLLTPKCWTQISRQLPPPSYKKTPIVANMSKEEEPRSMIRLAIVGWKELCHFITVLIVRVKETSISPSAIPGSWEGMLKPEQNKQLTAAWFSLCVLGLWGVSVSLHPRKSIQSQQVQCISGQ